jgi:hypothetical protein
MASLQSLPTDALALRDVRLACPRPLSAPPVLTPTLRAQFPPHPGYEFSWGQLIEWPGALPDPDTEDYTGTRWSIIPVSVWQAIHPSLREVRWHLHHLLRYARFDGADCVEWTLPPFVYLDTPQRVSLAGFLTLSGADAAEARRWLAGRVVSRRRTPGSARLLRGATGVVDRGSWAIPQGPQGRNPPRRTPAMIAALRVPPRLAGQPRVPCGVPETLIAVMAEQGIGPEQHAFEVFTKAGVRDVSLADEFEGALGYAFDWGWVLPYLPAWCVTDEAAGVAWLVVPVALWGKLAARKRLFDPVPAVLEYAQRHCLAFVHNCLRAPVIELSLTFPHDVCTLIPSPDDHAGELVAWLEADFLPREMPRLLRLLHSLALRFAHEIEGKAPVSFGGSPAQKNGKNRGLASKVGQKRPYFAWTNRRRRAYILTTQCARWL